MGGMCRFVAYLGDALSLDLLLLRPSNSLVHQSFDSKEFPPCRLASSISSPSCCPASHFGHKSPAKTLSTDPVIPDRTRRSQT